ncbi:MAG: phosphoglycerate mutase family protein [Alphaproteobacteria bacterium]|nr:phosphoglycerate mutase family protein [Alphaproteobacteria bacterium]
MHFIRHGQSTFNAAESMGDPQIPDAPLTARGLEQARQAGEKLKGKGVTRLIVSPYTRALQTATAIAEVIGASLHVEPLAGERCLYSCDIGTPLSRLRKDWAHLDFAHLPREKWWPEFGESHEALTARVQAFGEKWNAHLAQGDHALVSHWYFLNALTGHDFENGEVLTRKN